jgi:arginine repressor
VLKLREEYSKRRKDKLVVLLGENGVSCSASTVGRIIRKLKERGVLKKQCPTIYQPGSARDNALTLLGS